MKIQQYNNEFKFFEFTIKMVKIWQILFVNNGYFWVFVNHFVESLYKNGWKKQSCWAKQVICRRNPVHVTQEQPRVLKNAEVCSFLVILLNQAFHKRQYTVVCIKIWVLGLQNIVTATTLAGRCVFADWDLEMHENDPKFHRKIFFSDEADFHLGGSVGCAIER